MTRRRVLSLAVSVASFAGIASSSSPALASNTEQVCIDASESALASRKSGKLHETLRELSVCADPGCSSEVRTECSRRIIDVTSAMPTLILAAQDAGGNDLAAVTVTMDGAPLVDSLDGHAIAIDPGSHAFHFETGGLPAVDKTLILREGEHDRKETVVLAAPVAPTPASTPSAATSSASHGDWSTRKTLAVVSAGVGVVGLALGAIYGGLAVSDKNDEKNNCSSSGCGNRPQANADYDTAKQNATGSTIAFLAGGAFVAAGAVLWLTAPSSSASTSASSASSTPTTRRGVHLSPSFGRGAAGFLLGGEL